MDTNDFPLFPLGSLLFPGCRMTLQIFEPRYLDMIKVCMREQGEFGVVGIRGGHELARVGYAPSVFAVGTCAEIVDWNSLENGRLGITVEGRSRFQIQSTQTQSDFLLTATVSYLSDPTDVALPENYLSLVQLLRQLALHPVIAGLGMTVDYNSSNSVSYGLAQLLPVSAENKQAVLACENAIERLKMVSEIADALSS